MASSTTTPTSTNNHNSAQPTPSIQIDVDQLARDKVDEVEKTIASINNIKLESLNSSLSILKQIITAADLHRSNDKNDISPEHHKTNNHQNNKQQPVEESIYADFVDDNEQFTDVDITEQFATNSVKWTIRVRAFKLVHKIVQLLTRTTHPQSPKTPILKQLPDLVRLSFVAATSPYDDLKMQGFEMFRILINMFAGLEEKEFPGHSILEQYRTQVLSAIKPAFDADAPPYITAIASQICSLWLCLGMEKNKLNLKRTFQLMVATISKLENQSLNQNSKLYTESELEKERLDILGSWAQMYIVSKGIHTSNYTSADKNPRKTSEVTQYPDLLELVQPHIASFVAKWWEALKDYALLIMPTTRIMSTTHDDGQVYTRDVALRLFEHVWPKLVHASTIWLCENQESNLKNDNAENEIENSTCTIQKKTKYLKFILGIIMKELYRFNSYTIHAEELRSQVEVIPEKTLSAIRSLYLLVIDSQFETTFIKQLAILEEFHTIIYSILYFNSRSKSQHNQTLKTILDRIFILGLTYIKSKPAYITYSISKLISLINEDIKTLKESVITKSESYEQEKLKLYLKFCSLITIIKTEPKLATRYDDIRRASFLMFQLTLSFEADLSVSLSYLNLLKDIHIYIPDEHSQVILTCLFDVKLETMSKLYNLVMSEENKDKNTLYLDAYTKFIEQDISSAQGDLKASFMRTYVSSLLDKLSQCQPPHPPVDTENSIRTNSKDSILFDVILNRIVCLKATHPDVFYTSISSDMQDRYDAAIKQQLCHKAKLENEQLKKAQSSKKVPSINSNKSASKQASKIVLKADFSNFYSNKS